MPRVVPRSIALCLGTIALISTTLLALRPARAGDPTQVWWTIESEHFVINYYEPNEDIARRVAVVAERAHAILTPVLGHTPAEKTLVTIVDDTDGANGFASVLPRNAITLFATAPGGFSTLSDHDDWLYGLFAHEYTHVIHLDTIGLVPRIYNRIFGKQWAPNQVQPRWFIEGLATYEESKRSSSGRVRGAVFDMYLRAAILAGQPIPLDGMSSSPLAWPQGNTVYLYGSHFLAWIADKYGDDTMRKISQEYGRQPVPFGLNRAVRRAIGRDYLELYDDWIAHLEDKYALQVAAVERRGRQEGRRMTFRGQGNSSPHYSVDGRQILWSRSDGREHGGYWIVDSGEDADREGKKLVELDGGGAISMTPDGRGFVFERGNTWRTSYAYGDLYRFDLKSREVQRLSHGLRAADPSVSPDGKSVALTINGRSKMRLAVLPLPRHEQDQPSARVVWEGEDRWDQAFTPSWSPDGKKIAFSAWTKGGFRDLFLLDVASGRAERLLHDRAIDGDPTWTPDGRWIVFSSDRTGIFNLFAWNLESRELRQVTNVYGGAFSPDVSPDGSKVVYMGYDHLGFELFEMSLDERAWLPAEAYVDERPAPTDIRDDGTVWISKPRRYRPQDTLAPNTWTIEMVTGSFGSAVSVSTSGSDIVGHHSWTLGASLGSERGDVNAGAAYSYNRLWPSLRVSGARSIGRPGGLIIDNVNRAYDQESWNASLSVGLPVLRVPGWSSDFSFGYSVDWLRPLDEFPEPRPDQQITRYPEEGVLTGLVARWGISNVGRALYVVGATDGWSLNTSLRLNHPDLGGDYKTLEATYRYQQFFQMPWSWQQTLSLRLAGGLETTNRSRDGTYALGTLGDQDIVSAITDGTRAGNTGVLRGYEPGLQRGRQFHLFNGEYRFPLLWIERGWYTLPIYVRRLHGVALLDAGWVGEDFEPRDVKTSVGGALRLDVVFGFYEGGSFELGYARGLASEGRGEWWFLLTGGI